MASTMEETNSNPPPPPASQPPTEAQVQPQPEQEQEGGERREEEETTTIPPSPPLPQRHVAQTPGVRASRFQEAVNLALARTLNKISWDNFASCYPVIAAQAPEVLRSIQGQLVTVLERKCKKEFENISQARHVVARLNELETLVSEAERRRAEAGGDDAEACIPPHLLPAEVILEAHLAPHLAQQQSQLNAKLQTTQAHNANLYQDIKRQRAEIEALVSLLEKVVLDVDGANALMEGVVDDVARETRGIEGDLSG